MMSRKKLTFQLTPLLDLLLIVIFAQFMEMQQTSTQSSDELDAVKQQAAAQQQELLDAKADLAKQKAEMNRIYNEAVKQLERRRQATLANIAKQQEDAGRILSEAFDVPEETVNELLKMRPGSTGADSNERARRALSNLRNAKGRELLKTLVSFGEMQKRVDIWELHVNDDNSVEFTNGSTYKTFKAESAKAAEDAIVKIAADFPDSKTLVIILFSYGDPLIDMIEFVGNSLPPAVARLRERSGGRHWYEYAELGFTPDRSFLRTQNR